MQACQPVSLSLGSRASSSSPVVESEEAKINWFASELTSIAYDLPFSRSEEILGYETTFLFLKKDFHLNPTFHIRTPDKRERFLKNLLNRYCSQVPPEKKQKFHAMVTKLVKELRYENTFCAHFLEIICAYESENKVELVELKTSLCLGLIWDGRPYFDKMVVTPLSRNDAVGLWAPYEKKGFKYVGYPIPTDGRNAFGNVFNSSNRLVFSGSFKRNAQGHMERHGPGGEFGYDRMVIVANYACDKYHGQWTTAYLHLDFQHGGLYENGKPTGSHTALQEDGSFSTYEYDVSGNKKDISYTDAKGNVTLHNNDERDYSDY